MTTRPALPADMRHNMHVEQRSDVSRPPTNEVNVGFGPVRHSL
ncbi:hypothetical protein ACU635_05305 [[Actinomadura] parvosata]